MNLRRIATGGMSCLHTVDCGGACDEQEAEVAVVVSGLDVDRPFTCLVRLGEFSADDHVHAYVHEGGQGDDVNPV